MSGAIPGLVIPDFTRKQAEQASKQHLFMASASAPGSFLFEFLS